MSRRSNGVDMVIGGASSRRSFASVLQEAEGRPSGFDYLRLGLAIAVFVVHISGTTYGTKGAAAAWGGALEPFVRAILPMFFALSGFLVAGSMERCATLVKFLGLRAIRIYPALAVEVLLSALIIGPLVTTISLQAYFTDPMFWRYVLNVTGHISFFLPGVFADNPIPDYVNRQLWTVPYELDCYIVLGALIAIGAKRHRILLPIGTALLLAAYAVPMLIRRGMLYETNEALSGQLLVVTFLIGVCLYAYRERVPFNRWLFIGMAALSILCLSKLFNGGFYLATLPVAYVTAYLGLLNPPRVGIIRSADYSYGIFLYGYVVQQLVMSLPFAREWYWNLFICLPLTILVAALSWHFVEKPAAGLKLQVNRLESWWLRMYARLSSRYAATVARATR
jgi:peptidoglycan/LPS O-acetylase OafA/YrhL